MSSVLKVSHAASLAVHTMAFLARGNQEPHSVKEIASILHVSEAHLAKVLGTLARAGLVQSTRGPSGGFVMAPGADQTPLMAVFEAIEGKFAPTDCLFEIPLCGDGTCIFGDLVKDMNERVSRYLTETRVSDTASIFQDEGRRQADRRGKE
jgi:Rrf2 family protein